MFSNHKVICIPRGSQSSIPVRVDVLSIIVSFASGHPQNHSPMRPDRFSNDYFRCVWHWKGSQSFPVRPDMLSIMAPDASKRLLESRFPVCPDTS